MANWQGKARSNIVRILDRAGLDAAMKPFGYHIDEYAGGKVCFISRTESGGIDDAVNPANIDIPVVGEPNDDGLVEFDPGVHICPFMAPGEILVFKESGAQGILEITGRALAFNQAGECEVLLLDDIYSLAEKRFSKVPGSYNAF